MTNYGNMKTNFLLATMLFSTILLAQEKGIISGTILDTENHDEPVLFAQISLKGTQIRERTNIFGNFEIKDAEPGDYILTVAFAGYETENIPVVVLAGERTIVNRSIQPKTINLNEIAHLSPSLNPDTEHVTDIGQSFPKK